ncbi:uncharacterized protein T551_00529 [Pneumocystis jirovecii RU7]|uniref:Disintegrin domain-containing protein n=1 Tax=Pneumocystis jirovecii (strain RU7) TaxID=1408657 RepID=A0A0W4ZVN9_PNEJ7|nr:uncharacterized protein T551_00529 [Pneumocystis jirovecii RU7]KTW32439.1 hypothetical protein T551_00529 [Pneumocystis jirovecii RU7]
MQPISVRRVQLLENVSLFPHFVGYPEKSIDSYSSFDLVFALPYHFQKIEYLRSMKKYVKLTMKPNLDLLNEMSFLRVQNEHGETVYFGKIDRNEYKVYSGKAYITYTEDDTQMLEKTWYETGWARISFLRDKDALVFEGSFSLFGDLYTVKTLENYMLFKESHEPSIFGHNDSMVIWCDSDQSTEIFKKRDNMMCMFKNLDNDYLSALSNLSDLSSTHKKRKESDVKQSGLYPSRDQLSLNTGNTDGCPKYKKIAFMAAALDCNYVSQFQTVNDATRHIISLYNKVSAIYEETFNISLGLLNITVMESSCPVKENSNVPWNIDCSSHTISDRLRLFSTWRSKISDGIALWSLFTSCRSSSEVGVAWFGVLCQDIIPKKHGIDSISGTNVVASSKRIEDVVLAHEIGHGFGASHDCTEEACQDSSVSCCPLSSSLCSANGKFIMNPKSSPSLQTFSPCTIGQVCSNLGKKLVNSKCLLSNKNITLISEKRCGNGIIEDGEECDCGGEKGCKGNLCCDPRTCKFTPGSVCDDSSEACCKNCQFAPENTICRPSHDECDIVEVCSGNSSTCPSDLFKKDGTSCGNGFKCASGICTSRNMQCISQFNNSKGACHSSCIFFCEIGGACVYSGLQNYFIDGTPCGFYGFCYKGNCIERTLGNQLKTLLTGFKKWIFIIVFVLGLLLVFLISCIFNQLTSYNNQGKRIYNKDYQRTIHIPVYTNYPHHNYQNTMPNYMSQVHFDPYRNYHAFNQENIHQANPNSETYYDQRYRYR